MIKDRSQYRKIDDNLFASPRVSEEVAQAMKDKLKSLGKISSDEIVAKYKIEVLFGTKHTTHGLAYGVLTLWENGSEFRGGGDSSLFICPGKHRGVNECEEIIPNASTGLSRILCPSCGMLWKREMVYSEQFFRMPIQRWADVILYWFVKTGMDADIKLKYTYKYKNMDIRQASEQEQEKKLRGDLLNPVRDEKHRIGRLYPLKNIIKDTSAGADLYTRILSFVRS